MSLDIWEYQYPKNYKQLPDGWSILTDGEHFWGYNSDSDIELPRHWNRFVARQWVFKKASK